MRKITLAITLFILASAFGQEKNLWHKIAGEKTLPNIVLNDINGRQVNMSSYGDSGRITVVSFWATWCAPCKKELTSIHDLYPEWQKKYGLKIVAVSIDDSRNAAKVKPYCNSQRWEYEVLLDTNQDLKRAFNVQTVPFTMLLDKTGKVVYTHSGYVEGDELVLEEEIAKLTK
jgi:cytochrome c biogenesis protein CcmG/thiol:disulfide interchange protein DsbE